MSVATPEAWAHLVVEYEAARERWATTYDALEALPVESGFDSEEERIHEQARLALDRCEDGLLS